MKLLSPYYLRRLSILVSYISIISTGVSYVPTAKAVSCISRVSRTGSSAAFAEAAMPADDASALMLHRLAAFRAICHMKRIADTVAVAPVIEHIRIMIVFIIHR